MKSVSVAEFLAHAVALEEEAAHGYDELARVMEVHNNRDVTALFRQMGDYCRKHRTEALQRAEGHTLPRLKSWEFRWNTKVSPEAAAVGDLHYLMTPRHALKLALDAERTSFEYYDSLAREALDAKVREMAVEFAKEEAEHVAALESWLEKVPETPAGWDEDHDPPVCVD
ncbi:MAG: ferritin-like domain-containing protein [Alphaproteobacteria bacterium]